MVRAAQEALSRAIIKKGIAHSLQAALSRASIKARYRACNRAQLCGIIRDFWGFGGLPRVFALASISTLT